MTHQAHGVAISARTTEELRAWQLHARYPQLLVEAPACAAGVVYRRVREGTGLVITALRHDALTAAQAEALAEFRLQQYVLSGWYDLEALQRRGAITDPAFEHLPWNTVHVLAGTASGHLLAYFCMQPAGSVSKAEDGATIGSLEGDSQRPPLMRDAGRPLFPTEIHSFSPQVFTSLPALRTEPVHRVRELSRLLRNQTSSSLLSAIAVVEAVCAMTAVAMLPESEIDVLLGCVDREARQVTARLGIPILFAPLVPTMPLPQAEHEYFWADRANEPGRFWPFAIATADLRPLAGWFGEIDDLLAGVSREVRRGIVALRRRARVSQPLSLAYDLKSSPVFWTADNCFEASSIAAPEAGHFVPDAHTLALSVSTATATSGGPARPAPRHPSRDVMTRSPGRSRRSMRRGRGSASRRASRRASLRRQR